MNTKKPIVIKRYTNLSSEMERIFNRLFDPWQQIMPLSDGKWRPNTDVFETDDNFMIRMELAGVSKDDINIILHDKHLAVYGIRQDPMRESTKKHYQVEINFHEFERIILLPEEVKPQDIDAEFESGMLYLTIKKECTAKREKTYTIKIK